MLELSIQKNSNVSIHQQLITQLSLQIASGHLPAGSKLPSVRGLSRMLQIHYNTCLAAYRELTTLGLVESKQGSGYTVRQFHLQSETQPFENLEIRQMARYFVHLVTRKGYAWEEVTAALERARREETQGSGSVTFVDPHADILPVFQAELQAFLNCPVQTLDLSRVETPEALKAMVPENTRFLVSRYHYRTLQALLPPKAPVIVTDVGSGQYERDLIKKLPEGALIVLVSQSSSILGIGEALIEGIRGHEVLVRTVLSSEGEVEIKQALKHASLIIADVLCAPMLSAMTAKPVQTLRVIPDGEIPNIQSRLVALAQS